MIEARSMTTPDRIQPGDPARDLAATISVHSSVVSFLGARILGGHFQPGDLLPIEADLADRLSVSRTSIREAIKVLSAKGLLESRPRVGIRVRPRETWRVLDPDVLAWHPNIREDQHFLDSLVESRRIIEPAAAELAALRATAQDLAEIEGALNAMSVNATMDMQACNEGDAQFHRAILAASHNIILSALAGTIEIALRAAFLATADYMDERALDAHRSIFEAIRFKDPIGARRAMSGLLDIAAEKLHG